MNKTLACFFLAIILLGFAYAETRSYQDEEIISYDFKGKTYKEKPGYVQQYEISGNKITQKAIAIRDIGGLKKGEELDNDPFNIISIGSTLPITPSIWEEVFGAKLKKPQKVIFAVSKNRGLLGDSTTNLILADDFSFEYRPTIGFGGITIFRGKRIK